ncbi:MAG: glutamate formimidoyltransferase [Acidobacteria bacterium]|nr:glutamate formimidoyltransferase [Acidobacteriota bacterium]
MPNIVECVPNFSEGRDRNKVDEIAAAISSVEDVYVLDIHMDADHHRSVITFVGSTETVGEATVRAVGRAAALIDMNRHHGEHPRIGAADVIPFIPVAGVTLEDCAALARDAGKEIHRRFQIPVYFYEAAASRPERLRLENLRRGGLERLKEQGMDDPSRYPDVGDPALHPTAGATVVGARKFLAAFNVNLNSADREVARQIAKAIRTSGGGLPGVKAMGVLLKSRTRPAGQAQVSQVSMNLTDLEQTSLEQAFQAVQREASRLGVTIRSSEVVGLIPEKALAGTSIESFQASLQIEAFHPQKILENRLAAVLPQG